MTRESKNEVKITVGGKARTLSLNIDDLEGIESRLGIGLGELAERLMEKYHLTDIRVIYEHAFARAGVKVTQDEIREFFRVESIKEHLMNCVRLIHAAMTPLEGNAEAPEGESPSSVSQSGAS